MERKTNEQFQKEARRLNHHVTVLGKYTTLHDKILVQCNTCGNQYMVAPGSVLKNHGCKQCANNVSSKRQKVTTQEFIDRMAALNPNLKILGEYINSKTPIQCQCLICGNIFYPQPNNLVMRNGSCPLCSKRKSHEEFIKEIYNINPYIIILEKYINNITRLECKCDICGHTWNPKPTYLLQGKGCPHCNMSKGELKIEKFLIDHSIEYKKQYTYEDCKDKFVLPFDFYLVAYNTLVEFDGKQHYELCDFSGHMTVQEQQKKLEITQQHDLIKNKYCEDNHIKLIRIHYNDYDNIETILLNTILSV